MCSCSHAMLRRLETFLEGLYLIFSRPDKFVHVKFSIVEGFVQGLIADCAEIDCFRSLPSTSIVCRRLLALVLAICIRGWTVWWHDETIIQRVRWVGESRG